MNSPSAIILAAGKGTRMKSDLPKVVHRVGGKPMVCAVVDACRAAGCRRIVVVVGYKQELVREALSGHDTIEFAVQDEQLGTGHAVMMAAPLFKGVSGAEPLVEPPTAVGGSIDHSGTSHPPTSVGGSTRSEVFVLAGDGPLIREKTLRTVLATHRAAGASCTLATSVIEDPTGYGRITRDAQGRFLAIVEHKNCTPEQLRIREVNPSYYCFEADELFESLKRVGRNPVSNEYYITDVPELLLKAGRRVEVVTAVPPEDVLSINTLEELARVDGIFRARAAGAGRAS